MSAMIVDETDPGASRASRAGDRVDAFCEGIGFTPDEVERCSRPRTAHGLAVKLHAEQLSATCTAPRWRPSSTRCRPTISSMSTRPASTAMADAGMVAVLLPGAFYALQETKKPPVDLLRKHSVPMAVATDCNPGTSPMLSPTLMMNMACTLFGLTPEEALAGMTVNAARALGLAERGRHHRRRQGRGPVRLAGRKPGRAWLLDRPAGAGAADFRGSRELSAT